MRIMPVQQILITTPTRIADALWKIFLIQQGPIEDFYLHLQTTVQELLLAFALSLFVGQLVGLALGASKLVGDTYEPMLVMVIAFPQVVLYPIIVLIFGVGTWSKVAIGFLTGFFYIAFNTTAAMRQVDRSLVTLAHSVGYGRWATFLKIIAPAGAPTIMGGLRMGFNYTYIGVIFGEIYLPNRGLGYLITWTGIRFHIPELYGVIIVTLAVGAIGDTAFRALERHSIKWRYLPSTLQAARL